MEYHEYDDEFASSACPTPSKQKDTKRKYEDDHIKEEKPAFRNVTEVQNTLVISEKQYRQIMEKIGLWFKKNPDQKPRNLRNTDELEQTKPCIRHLCEEFRYLFDESEVSEAFIKNVYAKVIQRYLCNQSTPKF